MGGYIGYKETGKDQVNAGAFETRQSRLAELVGQRDDINIKASELGSPVGAINKVETFTQKQAQAKEQAYRVKLNRSDREKALAVIKVKQSILGNGETRQMAINRAEEIKVAQQTRHEINEIAQNTPLEMALGPVLVLITRILRKLPDKAYKYLSATVILSMALSACSAINHKDVEVNQVEPAAETALLPDSAADDHAEVEVAPAAAATETAQVVDTVKDLYNRYLAGESIDVGSLSEDEYVELSTKLAEKKNADRGINVLIFDNGTGNPAFIDPNHDNKMMDYDGNADLTKTIEMFVPIAGYDEAGNLQFEVDGKLVTIGASAGVEWGGQITEYGDSRIKWPVSETAVEDGLTTPERVMKNQEHPAVILPAILLDKNLGQIYVTGPQSMMRSTFRFLVPEVDSAGHPLYAREILVTGGVIFRLYEEGSDLELPSNVIELTTESNFYKNLTENWTYYLTWIKNQNYIYGELNDEHLDHYQGLVSTTDVTSVLLGEKQNDQDMLSVATTIIIKAKVK